jgi:hypothetical protein
MTITKTIESVEITRNGSTFALFFYLPSFGWVINEGQSEKSTAGKRVFYYETTLPTGMDYTEIPEEIDAFTEGWARGKGFSGALCETEF